MLAKKEQEEGHIQEMHALICLAYAKHDITAAPFKWGWRELVLPLPLFSIHRKLHNNKDNKLFEMKCFFSNTTLFFRFC
jgi:hypothetical protein